MNPAGIGACLIVRDEEELLPACLESLRGFVDEICLLDTGSTDRTVAIAESHGARVGHFVWCDDFSAARNASIQLATMPWILVIDADERLDSLTGHRLREAATSAVASAFMLTRDDREANGIIEQLALARLFRNDPRIRFHRPVHESIMESLFAIGASRLDDCGAKLVHLGYLPEILAKKDKRARNLAILRRRFHDVPGDLYNAYKLAGTLGADANAERLQAFAAADSAARSLSDRERAELPFLSRLFDTHAAALHSAGQLTAAIAVADRGLAQLPKSSELFYRRGELARCVGDEAKALALITAAMAPREISAASAIRADRPQELLSRCRVSLLALAAPNSVAHFAGPEDLLSRCARIRRDLRLGKIQEAANDIGPLLGTDGRRDEVKLLAGELALALGDLATAKTLWTSIRAPEEQHRALFWLALLGAPGAELPPPRDVDEAALTKLFIRNSRLDSAFLIDALERATLRWNDLLVRIRTAKVSK